MIAARIAYELTDSTLNEDGIGSTSLALFTWDPSEPLVVRIVFRPGPDSIEWVISRDLLTAGRLGFTGRLKGDVTVWPVVNPPNSLLYLRLMSKTDAATVSFPLRVVRDFLARTEAVIPLGSERIMLDERSLRRVSAA